MSTLFFKILDMSVAASWLILAVILVRFLLRRAPKWVNCLLWGMVALRLLCPLSLESDLSLVPDLGAEKSGAVQNIYGFDSDSMTVPRDWENVFWNGFLAEDFNTDQKVDGPIGDELLPEMDLLQSNKEETLRNSGETVFSLAFWKDSAGIIWMAGVVGLGLYLAIRYRRIYRNVQASLPLWDNVWICDTIPAPFLLGVLKPRIYLPSDTEENQVAHIIAHERAHIQRGDHWWKSLGFVVLMLHWFNPLVWISYMLFCRDIELACDEKVIHGMDRNGSIAYSEALFACSLSRRSHLAYPLAFGEVGTKERVRRILNYKKPAFWMVLCSLILCGTMAVCFMTNAKGVQETYEEPFGHSFRVSELVYSQNEMDGYSIKREPGYRFTDEMELYVFTGVSGADEYKQGNFESVELTKEEWDWLVSAEGFWQDDYTAEMLRKENGKVWRCVKSPDLPESEVFYLLQQKDGTVYLTTGYSAPGGSMNPEEKKSEAYKITKLISADLVKCELIVDGQQTSIDMAFYPKGTIGEWEMVEQPVVQVEIGGTFVFNIAENQPGLRVHEARYRGTMGSYDGDPQTYDLSRDEQGRFSMDFSRWITGESYGIYTIERPEGTYTMKVEYPPLDSAAKPAKVSSQENLANQNEQYPFICDYMEGRYHLLQSGDPFVLSMYPVSDEIIQDELTHYTQMKDANMMLDSNHMGGQDYETVVVEDRGEEGLFFGVNEVIYFRVDGQEQSLYMIHVLVVQLDESSEPFIVEDRYQEDYLPWNSCSYGR